MPSGCRFPACEPLGSSYDIVTLMRPYTKPDLTRPIEEIRAEVQRDYETLAATLGLPAALSFEAAVAATKIGMVRPEKYPFKDFQQTFAETVARQSLTEEAFTDAFEIMTGVWNHFPHDDLGMSPVEKMRAEVADGAPPIDYDALQKELTSDEGIERMHAAIDERLTFLSDVAQSYLEEYLPDVGGTKKDARTICAILADPERDARDALRYLYIDMTKAREAEKTPLRVTMADLQPIVRVITMCENHIMSTMPNGHKNSRMFQYIAQQCVEYVTREFEKSRHSGKAAGSVTIIEPLDVLDMLLDLHVEIGALTQRLRISEGLTEAAHHILDWLALTDVNEILGRKPSVRAAHVLAVARLIAATGDPKHPFTALAAKLQTASGFADPAAYETEIARLAELVLTACGDPAQMMPVPGKEPDDCDERLATLAPKLRLRSPFTPDDLSIPSPFI